MARSGLYFRDQGNGAVIDTVAPSWNVYSKPWTKEVETGGETASDQRRDLLLEATHT